MFSSEIWRFCHLFPFKPMTLLQNELWSPLPVPPPCGLHLKIAKMKWRSLFHSVVAHTHLCV